MAKKGKKRPGKSGKKRVGATKFNAFHPIFQLVTVVAGIAAGKPINEKIDEVNKGKIDSRIIAGVEVGIGSAAMFIKLSKKRQWWEFIQVGAGGVTAGAGLRRAYDEIKKMMDDQAPAPVAGYQKVPVLNGAGQVTGYQMVPVIGKRMNGGYRAGPPVVNGGYHAGPPAVNGVMGNSGSGSGRMESNDFLN